jgi:hypothetical protein
MGMPTMMAGSMQSILKGAAEVKKDELAEGKSLEDISKDLVAEGFSEHNIKRILKEIRNESLTDDIPQSEVKDAYKIKENTMKIVVKTKPLLKVQDLIRFKSCDWVVQQINDFGTEFEILIKK